MSSESEDEFMIPRYVNKKVRKDIEVEVSDLVAAGYIQKDNPASSSALEDSLQIDLDNASAKLKAAKDKQEQLKEYLTKIKNVSEGKTKSQSQILDQKIFR